ncbi:MAG: hypothetical protein GXP41_06120 [Chloroflexi bacterium]|nr:hypothetical protein [Chloroflexota bacterium]
MRRIYRMALVLLAALLLPACSNLIDATQPAHNGEQTYHAPGIPAIGQTFVASHDGLSTIYVALGGDFPTKAGSFTLHLRAGPSAEPDLRTATARGEDSDTARGFVRFPFAPLPHSHGQRFFFSVEASPSPGTTLIVPTGSPDSYFDGAAYLDDTPQDFQTIFQLGYSRPHIVWGLLTSLPATLPIGILILLPGLALIALLLPKSVLESLTLPGLLTVAIGLSLALTPLLFLWMHTTGPIKIDPLRLGVLLLLALVGLGWGMWRRWHSVAWKQRPELRVEDWAVIGLAGLILAVRFLIVRSISFPLWGDSVQHTAIALRMVESGGLFDTWLPYAPYDSFTVHFGFHSTVALFHWVSGIPVVRSVLLTGQLLNGLAALTLFPLAVYMFHNRWAGLGAVFTAGILSPLPMFYVNWGRYPQLAGQVILPLAILLLLMTLENGGRGTKDRTPFNWKTIIGDPLLLLTALFLAGMTLTYYRMPYYLAAFLLAWFLIAWLPTYWRKWGAWSKLLLRLAVVGGIVFLLLWPQMMRLRQGHLVADVQLGTAGQPMAAIWSYVANDYHDWYYLGHYLPPYLQWMAIASWLWSIWKRERYGMTLGIWVLVLALLPAGILIHLPGATKMQSFAIIIALYIPVGLLIGYATGELSRSLLRNNVRRTSVALLLMAGIALWSVGQSATVLQPSYMMVTKSDEAAMHWIRQNTSAHAKFLVNGFRIYAGTSSVGSDGGWWIPLLSLRANTMPPQYALLNEQEHTPGYGKGVTDLVAQLETVHLSTEEGVQLLCSQNITHVYIGQGQGKIGNSNPPLFTRAELEKSPQYRLVYRQDRVAIFALKEDACPQS